MIKNNKINILNDDDDDNDDDEIKHDDDDDNKIEEYTIISDLYSFNLTALSNSIRRNL